MDETRAAAKWPHLDIEITHRRVPDEGAEQLSIHLRATPSFGAFADYLERTPALWSTLMLSPFLIWQQSVRAFWAPWLPAPRALPGPQAPRGRAIRSAKVHPFPGPDER